MANMTWGLKWSFEVVAIPQGANPMEVPSAQSLKVTQATAFPGQTPGGVIVLACTGSYPTTTNMSTALTAAATAGGAILNATPAVTQWQQWYTGQG